MSGGQLHFIVQDNGTALPLTDIHAVQETLKRGTILRITPGSGKPVELVAEQHLPDGIDIAQSNGRMYWSNMGIGGNKNGAPLFKIGLRALLTSWCRWSGLLSQNGRHGHKMHCPRGSMSHA